MHETIQKIDPQIFDLLKREEARQSDGIVLIPSENHSSRAVLEAMASVFNDKYAEGYPGKRYYAGNAVADELETLVVERARKLFGVPYANVQPYSGSPANFAIYLALCEPGDTIMGLDLLSGGHLTHGWKFNASSKLFKSVPYHMRPDGYTDLDEVRRLAREHHPKLIWCGGTAIPRAIPFKEFAEIADGVGAYLVADVSHIAGLIVGGVHESPAPYAHLIMTTTHKTLRGPRGAMIMVTEKGLAKDADLGKKIDKAIIPGFQGGPHLHTIAGIGVALHEASTDSFRAYAAKIVANAKVLAASLLEKGFKLVSGGTDNHLILIDLTSTGVGRGSIFHQGLEAMGIYTNKNTIPADPSPPLFPSGLRIGTPAVTSRGMGTSEMEKIAAWFAEFREHSKDAERKSFGATLGNDSFYAASRREVAELCKKFIIPGLS